MTLSPSQADDAQPPQPQPSAAGDTGAAPEHRAGLYSGHAMTAEQAQRLARRYGTRLTALISS